MSRDMDQSAEALEDTSQLVDYFRAGEKPHAERAFGTEHEKFVFRREDLGLLSFEEQGGYGDLFAELAERYTWEPSYDRGKVVALTRPPGEAITLEPGGQFELSGAVLKTVGETAAEFDRHIAEVKALAGDRLALVGWGMNPFDDLEDVPWMPKARYEIMRRYLPTRGELAHWMMKMTCTVQANFDYTSEEDAADMVRTGLLISPLVSALFANSPIKQGEPSGKQSFRCHIWTRTDPDRSGFPRFMYEQGWGYERYVEYLLDVPMFFIRRGGQYVDVAGRSFREFMREGYEGRGATMGDFELHLSTAFPEVRMKQYIEVRGADAGGRDMTLALPALWKGVYYSDEAREQAAALLSGISPEAHAELFEAIRAEGLRASFGGYQVGELAEELVRIAGGGLDAIAAEQGHGSEREFLGPLEEIARTRRTRADALSSSFERARGDRAKLIAEWEL